MTLVHIFVSGIEQSNIHISHSSIDFRDSQLLAIIAHGNSLNERASSHFQKEPNLMVREL